MNRIRTPSPASKETPLQPVTADLILSLRLQGKRAEADRLVKAFRENCRRNQEQEAKELLMIAKTIAEVTGKAKTILSTKKEREKNGCKQ